jgi:2'-5' RNA ligase
MVNNWISLNLPEDLRKDLYDIAIYLQKNIKMLINDQVEFDPMKLEDIHLTLVFCGEKLHHIKEEQKEYLNNIIKAFSDKIHKLKFTSYTLFPPYKENLIVAKFTCNKELNEEVLKLKREFVKFNIIFEPSFLPHITLGKIKNMKKEYAKQCNLADLVKIKNIHEFSTKGCYLCGKII